MTEATGFPEPDDTARNLTEALKPADPGNLDAAERDCPCGESRHGITGEPSARDALLSLADELDRKASTEQHGDRAISVWRQAAELARQAAQGKPQAQREAETAPADGGEAEPLSVALRAAADAIYAEMGGPAESEPWSLARYALRAAEPLIRADERARIRTGAEAIRTTLHRPGCGNGPAHTEHYEVVSWPRLAAVIEGEP